MDVALKALESLRGSHLTEAPAAESFSDFPTPSLSRREVSGLCLPRSLFAT